MRHKTLLFITFSCEQCNIESDESCWRDKYSIDTMYNRCTKTKRKFDLRSTESCKSLSLSLSMETKGSTAKTLVQDTKITPIERHVSLSQLEKAKSMPQWGHLESSLRCGSWRCPAGGTFRCIYSITATYSHTCQLQTTRRTDEAAQWVEQLSV